MYQLHEYPNWKNWIFVVICCIIFNSVPILSSNICTTCEEECSRDILESRDCYCKHRAFYGEQKQWNYLGGRFISQRVLIYATVECFDLYILDDNSTLNPSTCPEDTCKYLKFTHSNISNIPKNFFKNTKYLEEIYLNSSGVQHLQVGTFYGLDELRTLQLENNELTKISNGTLNTLTALRILDLHSNQISTVEETAFLGLKFLFSLDLSRNLLRSISYNLLKPLEQLLVLNLSHNLLSVIDFYTGSMKYLDNLYLNNNNIERIDECLEGTKITSLYLQNNHLSYINGSCFPDELSTLNLANNNITILDSYSLNNLSHLETLNFSKNGITNLPVDLFNSSKDLQILDLSQNGLTTLKTGIFSMAKNIEQLNISGTKIKSINPYVFAPLANLHILDISNNNLQSLDSEWLDQFQYLKLYMGQIIFSCKTIFSLFRQARKKSITLIYDIDYTVENINGLPCTDFPTDQQNFAEEATNKLRNSSQSNDKNFNELMEAQQNLLKNISNEVKILKDFIPGEEISRKVNINNELLLKLIKIVDLKGTQANSNSTFLKSEVSDI